MAIVARRGSGIDVTDTNDLATHPSWVPVDERLIPAEQARDPVPVRCMTHLHSRRR